MTKRLKRTVICSIALEPRFFKWKRLSLSGPNTLLFLQLLIALVTMSAVKISAWSPLSLIGFPFKEESMPSFEVLNCLLKLAACCLDDETEIPLKVIASFYAVPFALPSFDSCQRLGKMYLLVHVFNKFFQFFPFMLTDAFSGCLY